MIIDIRIPSAGESITQVELARWLVEDGAYVEKDQEIAEIDSDKATLTINADGSGKIEFITPEGSTMEPGTLIARIDTGAEAPQGQQQAPAREETAAETETEAQTQAEAQQEKQTPAVEQPRQEQPQEAEAGITFSPQARKLMDELQLPARQLLENPDNRRITKKDILWAISSRLEPAQQKATAHAKDEAFGQERKEERHKMSMLRRKVSERLVAVKNQTAMLTTFQEVDMSALMAIRKKNQQEFQQKHGVKLGFMSFFARALTMSIPYFPSVNGYIDDEHIVIPTYADVGIAVSTPKGLMVPVIRNAQALDIAQLEQQINLLAQKARDNKISIDDLSGGTISITNGGVFGSLLSTPILNPPQSAILGMHNIVERPVAINGKVEIRPMMYLALSYDHRIIDGRESVGFLVKVKEFLENPLRMLTRGQDPEALLLGLQED